MHPKLTPWLRVPAGRSEPFEPEDSAPICFREQADHENDDLALFKRTRMLLVGTYSHISPSHTYEAVSGLRADQNHLMKAVFVPRT